MTPPHLHTFAVCITDDDIDFMGHVNNAVYLRWVQDAVIAHWRRVGPAEAIASHLWIALKHEITYRKPAYLGDKLVAHVRLDRVRRESAFFETLFKRCGEVIAEVQSRWCCVDASSRSPARISRDIEQCFFPEQSLSAPPEINRACPVDGMSAMLPDDR